jgi:hypothetical protein
LQVQAVVSVREGFKALSVPLNLIFIRRTPVDLVFLAQLSPQVDRAQLVSQLKRRNRGPVAELGRLVEWETFQSFTRTAAEERVEALIAESGLDPVLLSDILAEPVQPPPRHGSDFPLKPNAVYLPTFVDSLAYASRDELTSKPWGYYQLILDPDQALAPYVAMLFNSSLGRILRNSVASGTVRPSMTRRALEQLKLPVPNVPMQREVLEAINLIHGLQLQLDALDRQLTNQPQRVSHVLRDLRELGQHDPLETFTASLPFPLASILWRYQADADEQAKVEHLRRFFEASAAFFTTVLLSAFRSDETLFNAEKREWFRHVRGNLRRMTFGTWTKFGTTIAKSLQRLLNDDSAGKTQILEAFAVAEAFGATIAGQALWEILDAAREIRNQEAHSGIVGRADLNLWHAQLEQLLSKFRQLVAPSLETVQLIRPGRSENIKGVRHYDSSSLLQGPNSIPRRMSLRVLFEMEGGDALYLIPGGADSLASALRLVPLLQLRPLPHSADHACYFYSGTVGNEIEFISYHYEAQPRIREPDPDVRQLLDEFK